MTRREIYQMRRGLALETLTQQPQQSAPVPLKHVLAHHRTLEQHHRSLCSKMEKSPLRAGREMAIKHRKLWHHHAKIRTQLEERERNGETSAPAQMDMTGLTRRERYELRTHGMGWKGRTAGWITGANIGGLIGAAGGIPGGLIGAGIGGYLGQKVGHHLGEQMSPPDLKKIHQDEVQKRLSAGHKHVASHEGPGGHSSNMMDEKGKKYSFITSQDKSGGGPVHIQAPGHMHWDESKHPRAEDGEFT